MSALRLISNILSMLRLDRLSGIAPVRRLILKFISFKFRSVDSCFGMLPLNLLELRFKFVREAGKYLGIAP